MKKILFIGCPGSGKGTQAELLEQYNFVHLSTGDLIRNAFENNDEILIPYKESIQAGNLLPDKPLLELVKKKVSELSGSSYILDGAVRTVLQAEFVVENNLIDLVIYFSLSKQKAVERLTKRGEIGSRADDKIEVIENRFEVYEKQTAPVLDFLKNKVEFFEIDASPDVETIHKEVLKVLKLNE